MDIYERIDRLIQVRGISRRQLAQMAGIAPSTLNSALLRRTGLSPAALEKLAAALGMSVGDLMWVDPEMNYFNRPHMVVLAWLNSLGYKVEVYEEDAYMWIRDRRDNSSFEISDKDLGEIQEKLTSYTKFLVHELIAQSRKLPWLNGTTSIPLNIENENKE